MTVSTSAGLLSILRGRMAKKRELRWISSMANARWQSADHRLRKDPPKTEVSRAVEKMRRGRLMGFDVLIGGGA